jgi:thioredoxin 1
VTITIETKIIPITRMDCPTCIPLLEHEVQQLEGVNEARGNYLSKTLKVTFYPDTVQLEAIEAAIERVGYRIAYKKYPSLFSKLKTLVLGKANSDFPALNDTDFPGKVLHAARPVAILFTSPTCPVCHMFKEQFKKHSKNLKTNALIYEMDIASTDIWRKYDVQSIPTVLIFQQGQLTERFDAIPQIDDITRTLDADLQQDQ